jgi:3',5'-cyclic AMP phosphodiesterase CpdA
MIIAQISDSHIAIDAPDAERRLSDLALAIADINALEPQPDAIVHTGDVVHNGRPDEYAAAAAILAKARAPLYVLAGNKDDRGNLRAAFQAEGYLAADFPFIQYAIDRHRVRLIALDTLGPGNKGDFCRHRLDHLHALLEAAADRSVAVFAHHPPFLVTEGPEALHYESLECMANLRAALARSGRIAAIFSGHVHRAAWGDLGGIPAIVTTAVATSLRHGSYPPLVRDRPVYCVHRFDQTGGFTSESRVAGTAGSDFSTTMA